MKCFQLVQHLVQQLSVYRWALGSELGSGLQLDPRWLERWSDPPLERLKVLLLLVVRKEPQLLVHRSAQQWLDRLSVPGSALESELRSALQWLVSLSAR